MKDVQKTLDRLVPEPARMSDWDAVVRQAHPRRRSLALQLGVATAVAAFAALFVVAPWKGSERVGVLDKALAAVGDGPVLHVVLRGDWGGTLVDLKTGARKPLYSEREMWFDPNSGLVHYISRFGGVVEHEDVYRRNEKDHELTALWQDYRVALERGTARVADEDVVDGTPVYWIIVQSQMLPDVADNKNHELAQQVAISKVTFKPVAMKWTRDRQAPQGTSERILRFETVPLDPADFRGPTDTSQMGGQPIMSGSSPTAFESATRILGRTPYWLGPEYSGIPLAQTQKALFAIGRPPERSEHTGVVFFYGTLGDYPSTFKKDTAPLFTEPYVEITQTTDRQLLTRGSSMKYLPAEGSMVLISGVSGYFVRDGVYITIRATSDERILDAARALKPMTS